MAEVTLEGWLVCQGLDESRLVETLLPDHVTLTRAEPGCLVFEVERTDDPLVFAVAERFADAAGFRAHQRRVAGSEWGRATSHIERRYAVSGLDPE